MSGYFDDVEPDADGRLFLPDTDPQDVAEATGRPFWPNDERIEAAWSEDELAGYQDARERYFEAQVADYGPFTAGFDSVYQTDDETWGDDYY